jgi:capsular exopolysaccharide synthesis family protein
MRTQSIKENLFLYLLQKREETALSNAITTAKTRTIDRARTPKWPVYPQKKLITASSILLGFFVPMLFIIIRSFFEVKVDSEETIKDLTSIPVLGRVAQEKTSSPIVVKKGSRTAINEMFRLIRANLNFANMNKQQQTIMVTSSISGEGKTFTVLNLGIAVALSRKKVILLGMDLRKPKIGEALGGNASSTGLSNYLVGECDLEEVIQSYGDVENLHFISSGAIPPNPTELLVSERVETLFRELKKQFDYIIIDTPPVSLVSDALLIRKYVDRTLVIVRQKHTKKSMVRNLEEMYQNGELESVNLIFNGIRAGGRYGYLENYQYGYGKGYYTDN